MVFLFVLFSVFSPLSACVCLCLYYFGGPTVECHLLKMFVGKCWVCWIYLGPTDPFEHCNCLRGTQHSTSQLKETCFQKMCFFLWTCWICWICSKAFQKCFFLQTCGICWICWMVLELTDRFWTPQLPGRDPTFNITAERSLFFKCASVCGMLNMLNMFKSLS